MRLAIKLLIGVAVFGLVLIVEGRLRQIRRREAALRQGTERLEEDRRAFYGRQRVELLKLASYMEGGSEVLAGADKGQFTHWIRGGLN